MKKVNTYLILKIFFILLMLMGAVIFWNFLPAEMPMHWNVAGEVDRYWPKLYGAFFAPLLAALFVILFSFLSKIDPKKEKYKLFRKPWEMIQLGILGFITYLQFVTIYMSMHPAADITKFIFVGIGIMFVLLGNYMGKIRQNYFIGVKTPWALADERVWNKTQRMGGIFFVLCGLMFILEAFLQWYIMPIFIVSISLTVIVPIVYSYLVYRGLDK